MTVEAKICGLSTPETVDAAVEAGADYVGFVAYPPSPRHISTDTLKALGKRVPQLGKASDVEQGIKRYARLVDLLMFDTDGGKLPGGNAKSFDWTVLSGLTVPVPWMLAGGLTADNVAEAVRVTDAPIVDVSSGVEATRGVKSIEKIQAFLEKVRGIA